MQVEQPVVSVLMPCYNAEDTLEEALDSLAHQTLGDYELIVIDDGSQDQTLDILQRWAERDRRLRVLARPHEGIIPALNAGLALCRSEWVARMDADDRSHPERLERQAAYLAAHPEVAVVSCQVEGFADGPVGEGLRLYLNWLNGLQTDEAIRREMFIESPLVHPSVTYRRQAILKVGGYQDRGWPEDYDLWLRLYRDGACFSKVPETLFSWRDHPGRLTRTGDRYSLESFLRAKAFYLLDGPLAGRDAVFIWGAGDMGRRLGKRLLELGAPLAAYVDVDPRKIGRRRLGFPILAPDALPSAWGQHQLPVLLAAVGTRNARPVVRRNIGKLSYQEGRDWWFAA